MALAPDGRVLHAPGIELRPLRAQDAPALFVALDDPQVWASGYGGGSAARPADAAAMERFVSRLLGLPNHVAYALRLTTEHAGLPPGTLVGTSSLGDIDLVNAGVHLGWTAYAPAVWATTVNPAAKLALLRHAFEDCGVNRVRIQTDLINLRSQGAIARLGAVREGVLREVQRRADGTWRDTVVFSILASEWPGVRDRLEQRLAGTDPRVDR